MKAAGIVAEYDPFHKGHAWQIARARQEGAQAVAVCMSGDVTQRGGAALLPPAVRARAALAAGADLVLALPNPYACLSAEGFAAAGVALLRAVPALDTLVFGAETPDSTALPEAARALLRPEFGEALAGFLRAGQPFAAARAAAAEAVCPGAGALLRHPNNNLGVEYCKALLCQGGGLSPLPLPRQGAAHGQEGPGEGGFASASHLRELWNRRGPKALAPYVPAAALALYTQAAGEGLDLDPRAFEVAILSRLRALTPAALARVRGTGEGLEYLLAGAVRRSGSLDGLYGAMKSKRYAHARLRRYALDAALGYTPELPPLPPYLHVLAANGRGLELLKGATLPADTSLARLKKKSEGCAAVACAHAAAADLAALCRRTSQPCGQSYTQKPALA